MNVARLVDPVSLALANLRGRPPRIAPGGGTAAPSRFRHHDWIALTVRFVQDGNVDYVNLTRVRRLLEAHLDRMSEARPDDFEHRDQQLAFYINAYNAIAVHQVVRHYPVTSLRDIPASFARPYPVGRENLSLHELLHAKIRAFGDPRAHAAVVPAAASAPPLRTYAAEHLRQELDDQLRSLLNDPMRGLRVESTTRTLWLSRIFLWYAGDFSAPGQRPGPAAMLSSRLRPALALDFLRPYMPAEAITLLDDRRHRIRFLPYDWRLNSSG